MNVVEAPKFVPSEAASKLGASRSSCGTDEVLWELVAAGMKPDYDGYAEFNQLP